MKYAVVKTAVAPLFAEPGFAGERADEVLHGMKVQILEDCGNGWLYCETHYHYSGYIHEHELCFDRGRINAWDTAQKCLVYNAFADVLLQDKIQSKVIITLTRGAQLQINQERMNGCQKGYMPVLLPDGSEGYIKEKCIGPFVKSMYEDTKKLPFDENDALAQEELRRRIATTALLYIGTQYRWGGKSPLGIDCSGLCSMAYMMNGIVIYRDASINESFPVKEKDFALIETGDLMYFKGHMAMYLEDGRFVHSTGKSGSDGVVISSLNPEGPDYREDLAQGLIAVGGIA